MRTPRGGVVGGSMVGVNPASEAATPKACPSCGKRYPADALFCSFDGAPLTTTPGAIAAAAATDVYVGREIGGHIEIRQLVGIGAMGRVYRAFQKGIDRDVAVKILHRELSANQTLVQRFHREAKVASRLAHPNVVQVLLAGQLPDGAMYIVMEYLDGLSLQSALGAAGGAMPLPRALHVALQLCDAAGEAHAQGIVHRDLKPENVMLVRRSDDPDYVKVLDFGIARLNWGEQSMATAAGLIFGTARYISPEGAQGEKVGPQGDVYSMATILYQMLAGRAPFDADQAVALLVQQIHDAPRPLKSIERAAYVPDPVAAVVMQNLSKRPEERAENGRELGRALLEAAVESGLSAQDLLARPGMLPGARGPHPSAVQLPSMQRTKPLQLGPEDAARLAAVPAGAVGEGLRPGKTAYETPEPVALAARAQVRTEIADVPGAPTVATTRWTPPADFDARLVPAASPSGVDLTMDDSQALGPPPLPAMAPSRDRISSADVSRVDAAEAQEPDRGRVLAIVALCFVLGAAGMGGLAYKLGLLGGRAAAPPRPAPAALVSASDEDALPVEPEPSQGLAGTSAPIPPLAVEHSASAGSPVASVRTSIDVSAARPGVGQPVDFTGHVVGGRAVRVEGARFHFSGGGMRGADVGAVDDGAGSFRASFTFLQAGRYLIEFSARADGAVVRTWRVVVVGDARPASPAVPTARPSAPPPGNSATWM